MVKHSLSSPLRQHGRFLSCVTVAECIIHLSRCWVWPLLRTWVMRCSALLGRNPITENKLSPQMLSNKLKLNITGLQAVYHPHSHPHTLCRQGIGWVSGAHQRIVPEFQQTRQTAHLKLCLPRETGIGNLESGRVIEREREWVKDEKVNPYSSRIDSSVSSSQAGICLSLSPVTSSYDGKISL